LIEHVYDKDINFLDNLNKKEIKVGRNDSEDFQHVSFDIEILNFSKEEISKIIFIFSKQMEIYRKTNKQKTNLTQEEEREQGKIDPLYEVFSNLDKMSKDLEKIISDFLKYIDLAQCYSIYYQCKYLLKNNFHPFPTYFKLTFIKRFFKNPIFRFLLVLLMNKKIKEFNIFHKVKYHNKIETITKNCISKYLLKYYENCCVKIQNYIKVKKQNRTYTNEKLSIQQQMNIRFIKIANFYVELSNKEMKKLQKKTRFITSNKSSQIFEQNYFFDKIENKINLNFSQNLQNKNSIQTINKINDLFCIDYMLKKLTFDDFTTSKFSKSFANLFLNILNKQQINKFLNFDSFKDKPLYRPPNSLDKSTLFLRFFLIYRMIIIFFQNIFQKWEQSNYVSIVLNFLFSNLGAERLNDIISLLYNSLDKSFFIDILLNSNTNLVLQEINKLSTIELNQKFVENIKNTKFLRTVKHFELIEQSFLRTNDEESLVSDYNSFLLILCFPQFFKALNFLSSSSHIQIKKSFKEKYLKDFISNLKSLHEQKQSLKILNFCSKIILFEEKFKSKYNQISLNSETKQIINFTLSECSNSMCVEILQIISQISFWKVFCFKYPTKFFKFLEDMNESKHMLKELSTNFFDNASFLKSIEFTKTFLTKLSHLNKKQNKSFFENHGGINWIINHLLSLEIQQITINMNLTLNQNYSSKIKFIDSFTSCVLTNPNFWIEDMKGMFSFINSSTGNRNKFELEFDFLKEIREQILQLNRNVFLNDSSLEGIILDFEKGKIFNNQSFQKTKLNLLSCNPFYKH
jgi:hypothetical protein